MTKRGNGGGHNNHAFGSGAKEGWSGGEDERGAESLEKMARRYEVFKVVF